MGPRRVTQKRVLVTGAGGFVGRSISSGLTELGWEVTGLDHAYDAGSEGDGVRRVTTDLADGVPAEVGEVDLIVHAAWVTTDPGALGITTTEYIELNLRPLLAVVEYAASTLPTAFVFLSSSGVFAPDDATGGLTDADQPTGSSPYAVAKRAGELLLPAALADTMAVHVVRLGYLFGRGETARRSRQGVSLVARWLAAAQDGRPLEVRSDDPSRDWTFTPDLAAALARLVEGPPMGHPIHVASPFVCTDRAIASLIADELGGAALATVPAVGPVKPPMRASEVPALRGFQWTTPRAGLRALLAGEARA